MSHYFVVKETDCLHAQETGFWKSAKGHGKSSVFLLLPPRASIVLNYEWVELLRCPGWVKNWWKLILICYVKLLLKESLKQGWKSELYVNFVMLN